MIRSLAFPLSESTYQLISPKPADGEDIWRVDGARGEWRCKRELTSQNELFDVFCSGTFKAAGGR